MWEKIQNCLEKVYTEEESKTTVVEIKKIITEFKSSITPKNKDILKKFDLTSSSIALIAYANSIEERKIKGINVLRKFINNYKMGKTLNTVHILPFYPWDTDRGFSVTDYYKVDPNYGDWVDIKKLASDVKLMFDFVANHASVENPLVQGSLIERHLDIRDSHHTKYKKYKDFVIAYSDENKPTKNKLKKLARPRPNPVLTRYSVIEEKSGKLKAVLGNPDKNSTLLGKGFVWTTFSRPINDDGTENTRQVDLNFANPFLLIETIRILLFYVKNGARLIRLDAIGYVWKKLSSTSLHEPEAHIVLEIIHNIMALAAPGVITIAEVNEPQDKVYKYLGKKGSEESDLVYQFTHFPLAVYAVLTGDGKPYKKWLKTIGKFGGKQFITVMGSHDGMGLKPIRGFLTEIQINKLTEILVNKHHALPNYAHLPGGKEIIYEICSTPWNLINKSRSEEKLELQVNRYMVVLALGLMVRGLPAIYINGLLATPNYYPANGLDENRTVNRQVFNYLKLMKNLDNKNSQMGLAFTQLIKLLRIRSKEKLFNPNNPPVKTINLSNNSVIAAKLTDLKKTKFLITLVNVSNQKQNITIKSDKNLVDIISYKKYPKRENNHLRITLEPYEILWLK